jgi:methylated-DNA-protein-cysteine methyltransferase-like protein
MPQPRSHGSYARIHAVVRRIPRGRVATYGQVAALAGLGGHARQVGYALHSLGPESDVPWQRVVNARGEVSPRSLPGWETVQRARLEREGVRFDARARIDLARHGWRPRSGAQRAIR